jgi:hypothetical protein
MKLHMSKRIEDKEIAYAWLRKLRCCNSAIGKQDYNEKLKKHGARLARGKVTVRCIASWFLNLRRNSTPDVYSDLKAEGRTIHQDLVFTCN